MASFYLVKMKLAALYSGGKDSTYAIWRAVNEGHSIECLVSIKSQSKESFMYHVPNIEWVKLGARAIGLPLIMAKTPGEKEKELSALEEILTDLGKENRIDGVLSGAIASQYQKKRIDKIAQKLGQNSLSPLWGLGEEKLWKELIQAGFKVMVVGVYAGGLSEEWLGRVIDSSAVRELIGLRNKFGISLAGEGGELETLVVDCPLFKKRIRVIEAKKHWSRVRGELEIKKAELVKK